MFQESAVSYLKNSFLKGKLRQTYLFYGDESCGRHKTALAFASMLQCENLVLSSEGIPDSCGECESCRRISMGTHPDLIEVFPEGNEIRISQIRRIQELASLKPSFGKWQIFIIDPADKLNISSANSLLKTLEEAPEHVVFIMLSKSIDSVIPTVVSRSETIRFNSPSHQQAREMIAEKYSMSLYDAAICYSLSEGRFGKSLDIANNFDEIKIPKGIKTSHRDYLEFLELNAEYIQNELVKSQSLDEALKMAGKLITKPYLPLQAALKGFCRSLFVNSGLPYAFPLLFTDALFKKLDYGINLMKKSLEELLVEAKKSYPAPMYKEAESLLFTTLEKWSSIQLEELILGLLNWYGDALIASCGSNETLMLNLDHKEDIITVAKVEGTSLLRSRIEMLENALYMLRRYVQPSFIIENLITQIGGTEA